MNRANAAVLVVAFCVLIALPGASLLLFPEPQRLHGVAEVKFPELRANAEWPAAFEQYFSANFGFKRRLVQLNSLFGYHVLGDLQSDDVLIGRDDWLFLTQLHGWTSLRSESPLSKRQRDGWQRSLRSAKKLLRENTPFLYLLVPSKETIYPEFLPTGVTRARELTHLDEMLPIFESAGIDYIDLREPMRNAKSGGQLYDRLDSHWNGRGAEVGTSLLLARTGQLLKRPDLVSSSSARLVPRPSPADLALMLGLEAYLEESSFALVANPRRARRVEPPESLGELDLQQSKRIVFEVPDPSLPTALIVRDSFATAIIEAVSERFRRSMWIWSRQLDLSSLQTEQPDIVIVELTERFFSTKPPRVIAPPKR